MRLERAELGIQSDVVEAYKSISRIKYADWLSMSPSYKEYDIWSGNSFGLSSMYYANGGRCHAYMLWVEALRVKCGELYVYLYTSVIICNICYL